jgi:hypothetical protein
MKLRPIGLFGFAAILLTSAYGSAAFAQEQSNPPAPTAAAAGNSAAPNASQPPAPDSASATATTKRVWTNDDMGNLHRNSTISTFSGSANKPTQANDKPVAAKSVDAKRYQDQITSLQAKIPPLDDKIAQLQAVLSGNTVNQTRTVGGAHIDDWHEELVKLQKQRDDIETRISSLQDEARHKGVPENQIPQ